MSGLLAYGKGVLVALDQLLNTLAGGWPDETFSARCWRLRAQQPWAALRIMVDGIFFWQRHALLGGHCQQSWASEMMRAQLPTGYRR